MIAALLALLAAGALAVGYFADLPALGVVALVLAALALALVVFSATRPVRDESPEEPEEVEGPEPVVEVAEPVTVPSQTADQVVLVISGRRRYHRSGCELLAEHEVEELTEDEAREEGFTACSRCATSSER